MAETGWLRRLNDPRQWEWSHRLVVYGMLLAWFWPHAYHGINIWDEGAYPSAAMRILGGELFYRDFFSQPPFWAHLFAGVFAIFGPSLFVARTVWLLATPLIPIGVFVVARRVMPLGFALSAVFLTCLAPGVVFNREIPLAIAANLVAICWLLEHPRGRRAFVVGLIAGFTSTFRWDICGFAGLIGGGLLFAAWLQGLLWGDEAEKSPSEPPVVFPRFADGLVYFGGCLLGGFYYWMGWLLSPGFRHNFFEVINQLRENAYAEQAVPFPNILEGDRWTRAGTKFGEVLTALGRGELGQAWAHLLAREVHTLIDMLWMHLPVVTYGAVAIALALAFRHRWHWVEWHQRVAILAMGLMTFNQVYWRSGSGNLFRVIVPVNLAVALLAALFWERLPKPSMRRGLVAGYACLLALGVFHILSYPHPFEIGSPMELARERVHYDHPRIGLSLQRAHHDCLRNVQRLADQTTSPGTPIFAAPLAPLFYFLTDRPNPTYYEWMMPWWWKGTFTPADVLERRVIQTLDQEQVPLIFMTDLPMGHGEQSRFSNYAPQIWQWVQQNYVRAEHVGVFYDAYVRSTRRAQLLLAEEEGLSRLSRLEGRMDTITSVDGEEVPPTLVMSIPAGASFDITGLQATHFRTTLYTYVGEALDEPMSAFFAVTLRREGMPDRILVAHNAMIIPGRLARPMDLHVAIPEAASPDVPTQLLIESRPSNDEPSLLVSFGLREPTLESAEGAMALPR